MVSLHTLLMIFLLENGGSAYVVDIFVPCYKHVHLDVYFSYYILYVNSDNAYIYLKIVHSQIGSGGGGVGGSYTFGFFLQPLFLLN